MKASRERTILIAVLSVAGLGLGFDRFVIGSDVTGPSETSAGVVDGFNAVPVQPTTASVPQVTKTLVKDQATGPSFAQRLRLIAGSSAEIDPALSRDAFLPAPGWEGSPSGTGVSADNHARQAAEAFQDRHVLEAVLVSGDKRYAMIGGQTLFIGQTLDGYRLEAVYERSAVFQAGGVRVELGIKADSP